MIRLMIAVLICVIVAGTEPLFAKDYVLKLELKTDVETKVSNEVGSEKSESHAIEVLIAPHRRFRGKTTWDHVSLSVRGILTEMKDGDIAIEIDCRHSSAEGISKARTTVGMTPGQTVFIGGMTTRDTSETLNETRDTKRKSEFRLTLVEADIDNESKE